MGAIDYQYNGELAYCARKPGIWRMVTPASATGNLASMLRNSHVRWRDSGGYEITDSGRAFLGQLPARCPHCGAVLTDRSTP